MHASLNSKARMIKSVCFHIFHVEVRALKCMHFLSSFAVNFYVSDFNLNVINLVSLGASA